MSEPRKCAVCGVDLEPRQVWRKVRRAGDKVVDTKVRAMPRHARVRLAWEGAAKTKSEKVRLIGNSVCPEVAEAVVRANLSAQLEREAA